MKEISGDITATYRLTLKDKFRYLLFNFIRGFLGLWVVIPRTRKTSKDHFFGENNVTNTPGRVLINKFVINELPRFVQTKSIKVLDIGCGSGYMRGLLSQAGYSGKYLGIDVADYFSKEQTGFDSSFIQTKIEDFHPREKYDLVISNTAFEHIENDALASQRSKEAVAPGGVEVHIVPSFWSLFCYLFHGYRQYSPRRLKRIFGNRQDWRVYSLGGLASSLFHFIFITLGERILKGKRPRDGAWYQKGRLIALKLDRYLPLCPLIYVVISRDP